MTQSCRSRLARYRYAVRHSSDGDNTIWSRYKATQSTITLNSQIAELASWRQPRFLRWRRTRHTLSCRCTKPLGTAMNKKRGLATSTFGIQHDNLVQIATIRCNQHRSAGVSPSPLANNQHELPPIRNEMHAPFFVEIHLCLA